MEQLSLWYQTDYLVSIFLIFVRLTAFFTHAPFFGSASFPRILKINFSLMLSFFIFSAGPFPQVVDVSSYISLTWIIVMEISLGLVLSFFVQFIYMPLRVVGVQVGRTCGFGQGEVINPDDEDKFTILQHFMYIMGVLIFFVLDGHHLILKVLISTFELIPLGGAVWEGRILRELLLYFSLAFGKGISFAAPIIGAIIIGTFCFGILGKSMPQMNLLIIDLPVRICVGLMGIVICLPMVVRVFKKFLLYSFEVYERVIGIMAGMAA